MNQKRVSPGHGSLMSTYEYVLDKLEEGIHVVDQSGQTIVYNAKMAKIESMRKEDVLYKKIAEVFAFRDHENSTLLQALHNGQETRNVHQTYFNMKGREIVTVNNTYPVVNDGAIIGAVEIAKDVTKMQRILQSGKLDGGNTQYRFENIIGNSSEVQEVVQLGKRASRTNSSILIVGETGTGKELFAQSIHNASPRSTAPFISQNCAALPESLIEGLLFGTTKGSFTGAADKPGLLEMADRGTLLLDELNSLSPNLQAKLLRVIQEKSVRRIGGTKDKPVDVKIIATVNEDPLDAIVNNRLRKDLYYRLGVVTLFIPPLRERAEDIPQLVESFVAKYNQMFNMNVPGVSNEVMHYFLQYDWPGNIRELEHIIEGAMNLAEDDDEISFIHLPYHLRTKLPSEEDKTLGMPTGTDKFFGQAQQPVDLKSQLGQLERRLIEGALRESGGKVSAAAAQLHLSRQNLQYRIRKLGIKVQEFK